MKLGKTKDFPRGKLCQDDEGGVRIAIGVTDKTVIIDFGTSLKWIGLDKQTALAIAASIIDKAINL